MGNFQDVIGPRSGQPGEPSGSETELAEKRVLIDPSLLLHDAARAPTVSALGDLIRAADSPYRFELPASFVSHLPEGKLWTINLEPFMEAGADRSPPAAVRDAVRQLELPAYEVPPHAQAEHQDMWRRLAEVSPNAVVRDILFEEWYFLTHHSIVLSRVSRPFEMLADTRRVLVLRALAKLELLGPPTGSGLTVDVKRLKEIALIIAWGMQMLGQQMPELAQVANATSGIVLFADP